jgi:hypothetical protein
MIAVPIDIVRAQQGLPTRRDVRRLLVAIVCGGLLYGAVMGSHAGLDNLPQIAFSAVKVPMLLTVTFLLCLPSFVVVSTLLGLRDDLAESLRALVMTQAGITIILCALAPYTAFWYLSGASYRPAILFNGAMFAVASVSAQFILLRLYRPLIARRPRHSIMIFFWLTVYIAVGIQMAWVLRPFIGHPHTPAEFFREDSWTNAYVEIVQMILRVARGD